MKEHNLVGKEAWMKAARQAAIEEGEKMQARFDALKYLGAFFFILIIGKLISV